MEKEANGCVGQLLAQHLRKQNQVIIVDPDDIIRSNELRQLAGKMGVDSHIARQVAARELGEVEAIVQDRP